MYRLIKNDSIAYLEYPPVDDPEFDLDEDGNLFIFGYKMWFVNKEISVAKRFELGLRGFKAIGNYESAKKIIIGDIESLITQHNIDIENCLILFKSNVEDLVVLK